MLTIDLIGLLTTVLVVGIRYPHYVLLATFIHGLGQILVVVVAHAQLDSLVTAGAFGTIAASHHNLGVFGVLLFFSGSLANYIVSSLAGGIAFETTKCLLNPWANLKYPFSVINFRLFIISSLVQIWKIFT